MAQAKIGDTVKVHYTGRFFDGTEFDSSKEDKPFQFTLGKGEVIPGFENAVLGMSPSETRSVVIKADEAYGAYNKELAIEINRDDFPDNLKPEIGQQLELSQPDGKVLIVSVIDINDKKVTLDANHPLAGMDLNFDIKLLEIN